MEMEQKNLEILLHCENKFLEVIALEKDRHAHSNGIFDSIEICSYRIGQTWLFPTQNKSERIQPGNTG